MLNQKSFPNNIKTLNTQVKYIWDKKFQISFCANINFLQWLNIYSLREKSR